MLGEEEKCASPSDKILNRLSVQKCFRSRKSEGSYARNIYGGIFAHSELGKYLETHLGVPEDKQLPGTLRFGAHVIVGDGSFLRKLTQDRRTKEKMRKESSNMRLPERGLWRKRHLEY